MAVPAERPGSKGSAVSRDIFDAFFGGGAGAASARRGRPLPGADLRYDLRITFEEAVNGTEKEIEFTVLQRCETCGGNGAKPGTEPITCPQCNGRGEVRSIRQTMLGQMVNVSACPRCGGEGKVIETPCDDVSRRRPHGTQAHHARHDPGRDRRGPPDPPLERGRGRAARWSTGQPVRRGPRPAASVADPGGHRALLRRSISIAQAALGTRITVPTVEGSEEVEIKPGTQPNTEIRLRGKGVPHLRRSGQRGDLHVMVDVVVPTKLSKKARDLLAAYADEAGESVGHGGGGLLEKLGLG